jgi:hypothetical protein
MRYLPQVSTRLISASADKLPLGGRLAHALCVLDTGVASLTTLRRHPGPPVNHHDTRP